MRKFEEIAEDVGLAMNINDAEALLRLAAELMDVDTPQARAMANGVQGWVVYLHGDYAAALEHYQRALAIYEELADDLGMARMIGSIGNIYDKIGDHATALEFYHRAIASHEALNDRYGVARALTNIGIVYYNIGSYPAAIEQYHRALDLYDELGDQGGVAVATGNIGTAFIRAGESHTALPYFQRSIEIHEANGHIAGIASDMINVGFAHTNIGEYVAALESYNRALTLFTDLGIRRGVAAATGNMIKVHLDMDSIAEAQTLFDAMDAMQIDEPDLRAAREHHRATLQERRGDLDGAVSTLQRALTDTIDHGLRSETADIHKALRDLALKQNDLAHYVKHNNELTRITGEISGKDTATKLAMQTKQREIDAREREHEKHLAVLHSTLPKHIADRVARGEQVNDHYENAAVIFVDIVGFTALSEQLSSNEVIQLLDSIFTAFDDVCKKHDVVKIKTIGDSYMAVAFSIESPSSKQRAASVSDRAALAAIDMLHAVSYISIPANSPDGSPASSPDGSPASSPLQVRIGMHCGPVTAGVIGTQRLQYDVWGDTVNVASRMESTGEPGRIHVSEAFADALDLRHQDPRLLELRRGDTDVIPNEVRNEEPSTSSRFPVPYSLRERGALEIKGKGTMTTYWLDA